MARGPWAKMWLPGLAPAGVATAIALPAALGAPDVAITNTAWGGAWLSRGCGHECLLHGKRWFLYIVHSGQWLLWPAILIIS